MSMKDREMLLAAVLGVGIFALNIIANSHDLYNSITYFDKGMHVVGGAFVFITLSAFFSRRFPRVTQAQLIGLVFFVGLLWEVYEFFIQELTGVIFATIPDSLGDLVADVVGAVIIAVILFFVQRRKKRYNTINAN